MSYANHIVDESVDPKVALTAQQLITLALQRIATGTITPYAGDLDFSGGLGTGTGGADGVGIASVAIDGSNHLIVTLTDNSTVDAGLLPSGPAGPQGATGAAGSDGAAGVGIASVAIDGSNHLIVTLTDNSTVDAGLLPSGSGGVDGITSDPAAVTVDRGLILGLYDHTIAAGQQNAPPPASVFRSTVDGKIYQRLASGDTDLLNNAASEYGGGSSGGAGWGIADGLYYYGGHVAGQTLQLGSGILYGVPLELDSGAIWNRIGCYIDNSPSGVGGIRLGIYANVNHRPADLILEAGSVSSVGFGEREITISQSLPAGTYWLAVRTDDADLQLMANTPGSGRGQVVPASADVMHTSLTYWSVNTGPTGLLPSVFPSTATAQNSKSPRLWLRRV